MFTDPIARNPEKEMPLFEQHPYLLEPFVHFKDLAPMVYKPEEIPDIERPGDYITPPTGLPQIDWNNQVLSSSLDLHWNKRWVTNLGWQSIQFKGSEVQSVKDFNGEIINFKPYVQDGSEQMLNLGMTYHFSKQSFLSAQWNSFHRQDELVSATDYRWKQWTLLYVMNF
jgi:hypothetical protein